MAVDLGPKLGLLINADIGEAYYDQFRPFLSAIDSLLQPNVINSTTTAPPSSPSNGDAYIIRNTPSGAWTGKLNNLVVWSTEITVSGGNIKTPGWVYYVPNIGWTVWDTSAHLFWTFDGTLWSQQIATLSAQNVFNQFNHFQAGFNANADITYQAPSGATGSSNASSPAQRFWANYWDGSASQSDVWAIQNVLGSGTNPASTLTIVRQTGSSGFSSILLDSSVTIAGDLFAQNSSVFNAGVQTNFGLTSLRTLQTSVTVPATNTANANAANIQLSSSFWNGTGPQSDEWIFTPTLGSGTNPTTTLTLSQSGTPGTATFVVPNINFSSIPVASSATAGAGSALPATPQGYMEININGTLMKVPYYSV